MVLTSRMSSKKSARALVERIEMNAVSQRGCSVFLVILCLVLIPIVVSNSATTGLLTSTCDTQLKTTREKDEQSVNKCLQSSRDQVYSDFNGILTQEIAEIDAVISIMLEAPFDELNRASSTFYGDPTTPMNKTFDDLIDLLPFMYVEVLSSSLKESSGLFTISAYIDDLGVTLIDAKGRSYQQGSFSFLTGITDQTDSNYTFFGATEPYTGGIVPAYRNRIVDNFYRTLIEPDLKSSLWDNTNEPRWTSLQVFPSFDVGLSLMQKRGNTVLSVGFILSPVNLFLHKMSEESDYDSRFFIVTESGTWGQQNFLIAASHNETYVQRSNTTSDVTMLKDTEALDSVIAALAAGVNLGGGYAAYSEHAGEVEATLDDDEHGHELHHYLLRTKKWSTPHGLSWWVVVSVELDVVLDKISELHTVLEAEIDANTKEVDDEISDKRTLSIIMVIGIAVAMMIMAVVATGFLLMPLKEMQAEMSAVAEMNLEGLEMTTGSFIREVKVMQHSFVRMVANLREFRTYVPETVLGGQKQEVVPPTGNIALVFTDIEGSTALWKKNGAAMNTAMELHNSVIRKAYKTYQGYEVKTIGDAFMIAFEKVEDAIECCMEVIEQLSVQEWPQELELPDSGLQVRLGCHAGQVLAENNPLTSRIDYRGNTVNLASRVEGKARGGSLCITDEVKQALHTSDRFKVMAHGTHEIKGLGPGYVLHLVEPSHKLQKSEKPKYYPSNASALTSSSHDMRSKSSSNGAGGASSGSDAKSVHINNKKTGLSLNTSMATVAVCRLNKVEDKKIFDMCNTMVRAATEMAFTTDGTVGSVTGDTLTVLWNCGKACTLHIMSALRFAADLERRVGRSVMHVGVATGRLMHGNVGTRTSRFSTVFGMPLEIAEVALEFATHIGAFCVVADASSHHLIMHDHTLKSFVRPVDRWTLADADKVVVYFYHLMSELLHNILDSWDTASTDPPTSVHTFSACMNEVLGGTATDSALITLKTLAATHPEDIVLNNVVDMITADGFRGGAQNRVATFTRLPPFITEE